MSEETKQPTPEETEETTVQQEPAEEPTPEETAEKSEKKAKKKKEKVYTFTREQVEQMELAAKQLESVKEQFVRLTAEYENYRKRTAKEKDGLYQDARMVSASFWRCTTIWSGPAPPRGTTTPPTRRAW